MSDDSDPAEEPTPSDGADGGSGSDEADADREASSTPEPEEERDRDPSDPDAAEDTDAAEDVDDADGDDDPDPSDSDKDDEDPTGTEEWTTAHDDPDAVIDPREVVGPDADDSGDPRADGETDTTDTEPTVDADDTDADGDANPPAVGPTEDPDTATDAGVGDAPTGVDAPSPVEGDTGRAPGRADRGPEEVVRPANTNADAGAPADQPTATGDGGIEQTATTAAQKGMDAVNEGFDSLGGGGPDSDEEMPLTEHIEEMMRRLSVVFVIGAVVSLAVLFVGSVSPTVPSATEIIRFFWDTHIGFQEYTPHVYGPLEFVLAKLKVAGLAGLLVGLPVFVYQTYLFMRPGLFPNERRYYLAAIPTSFVLGVVGAAFAHVAVLPFVFDYFISYTRQSAILAFGLNDTFNLILLMMGYFAIVFQIPLFMQLAVMMNVVSRVWMEQRRLLFWGAFLGLAFTFIAADPTGFASIIVAATMIVLFEATLLILRWTGN
ncbi:twin-arginine translocase subunit TatC [Candidatus Halobonum tyrrellensis]|uniref:Sec-independent protein translocase protein TatC n=1 Tax=Candidatus Halobonum tyrrellensis G22 TaxID=1324957 RepID=V4IWE4_9EURY|nr:twin-arginine translocase subunit TatC [Candidatus Halobonum tyrrellensis]ESP87507.1 sec-independent protein secretion pathway component tatc [Candidatus Halobonum tyrrellensis G22]